MNAIKAQLAFLRERAKAIADGAQKLDGSLRQRAGQYANSARSKFWDVRTTINTVRGMDEERRDLHALTESCEDCVGYAEQEWVPIGSLPSPGQQSVCGSRCRCSKRFRNSETGDEEAA